MLKRCLWIEAESDDSPLYGEPNAAACVRLLSTLQIRTVYLQLFRRGYCWYEGGPLTAAPKLKSSALQTLMSGCRDLGVSVQAWINVGNAGIDPNPALYELLPDSAFLTDNFGISIRDYVDLSRPPDGRGKLFSIDTPGLWLNLADAQVRLLLEKVVQSCGNAVPGIDGFHLDFIRYPYSLPITPGSGVKMGFDFGYGPRTESALSHARFITSPDGRIQPESPEAALVWDNHRRETVTNFVRDTRKVVGGSKRLSVAALAWSDRAYLSAFQDWRGWLEHELIDELCLMSYTEDLTLFRYMVKQALPFRTGRSGVLAGIGIYKFSELEVIRDLEAAARDAGADGTVFFSYGELARRDLSRLAAPAGISTSGFSKEILPQGENY